MSRHYDVDAVRKEFPAVERMVYLDSGFQTPLARPVKAAIELFLREGFETAGPKSVWLDRVEQTRAKLARFLGVSTDEVAFTKNTSESMNIASNALPLKAGDKVLMIHGDHPNNAYAFLNLQRKGVEVRFIPMTDVVDADSFAPFIDERTRAISMSHVTFHAGHRFDIESVGAMCARKKLYFVVDVMQAIGVVPIDAKAVGASFIGSGSHKGLLVPQGLGLLYWDKALQALEPTYLAAASLAEIPDDLIARPDRMAPSPSARRFELGNFNLPAVHALGASLDMIAQIGAENIQNHCFDLGDHLIAGLDELGVRLVGPRDRKHRAPHIYVIGLPASDWLGHFEENGVRVSPERDGIRVSLGMFNTATDIDRLIDVVRKRGLERPLGRSLKSTKHGKVKSMKKLVQVLGLLPGLLALSPPSSEAADSPTLDKIKSSGAITIGYREASIPFSYLGPDQKPVGFSLDLCATIVDRIKETLKLPNVKVNYTPVNSSNRIPLIQSGTVDIECGGTANDKKRQEQVSFSVATFVSQPRWLVKADGPKGAADLKGKTIVVTQGSNAVGFAQGVNAKEQLGFNIVQAKDHAESFLMLTTGRASAFMEDDILLAGLKAAAPNPNALRFLPEGYAKIYYGLMFTKGDAGFKALVDDVLSKQMASGQFEKTYAKWFNSPIPPKGENLAFPLSETLKDRIAQPSDAVD